jgi:hypothetical protein
MGGINDCGSFCAAGNAPATIDGATLRVIPTPPTIHLKTADDVRLEMARVYRDMRASKLDMGDGTKLVYVLSQIGRVIEISDVQLRMETLERVLKERKRK